MDTTQLLITQIFSQAQISLSSLPVLIFFPAIVAAAATSYLGAKYFESISRQPAIESSSTGTLLILVGVIDGISIISMGMGVYLMLNLPVLQHAQVQEQIEQAIILGMKKDTKKNNHDHHNHDHHDHDHS